MLPKHDFLALFSLSVTQQTLLKLTLSKPLAQADWRQVVVRLVAIKQQPKLSFTYRYPTRDEVKNYSLDEGSEWLSKWLGVVFFAADLQTTDGHFNLIFNKKGDNARLNGGNRATPAATVNLNHNKEKKRLLDASKPYFQALDISDSTGQVMPTGQKKFKQINKYIEVIESIMAEGQLPADAHIADFGSGKGYLTFALYDFLVSKQSRPSVLGFELRPNLVDFCNALAEKSGFKGLKFIAQDINAFEAERLDMLIALHACDIATDIALAKGIRAGAKVIIVAPCCHKQVRKALQPPPVLQPIMKHGIMTERQAEWLTDGIRALILEAFGYKTKVFEFISTEHTPKNVMIVGIKSGAKRPEIWPQVAALKQQFGLSEHYLEAILADNP